LAGGGQAELSEGGAVLMAILSPHYRGKLRRDLCVRLSRALVLAAMADAPISLSTPRDGHLFAARLPRFMALAQARQRITSALGRRMKRNATMTPNPLTDFIHFMLRPEWPTYVFWVLMIAGVVIAIYLLATMPEQRRIVHLVNWACRVVIGGMWWQQTLWKLPPYYTDEPGKPFSDTELYHYMTVEGKSAAIPLQADFVNHVVLPHFNVFAPIVYAAEALTAVSLILGLFVGLWGWIGALQFLNLWLGLYNDWYEWPWTYFFALVLQVIFAFHHYGRSLGVDAILTAGPRRSRLLDWVS
jgi:hypothetical protein